MATRTVVDIYIAEDDVHDDVDVVDFNDVDAHWGWQIGDVSIRFENAAWWKLLDTLHEWFQADDGTCHLCGQHTPPTPEPQP